MKEDFFSVISSSDVVDEQQVENSPKVSVSAVVGMNGDGKSSLVELMMRLINNCAVDYNLCVSSNLLRRVKGVKAELYYLVDNAVYRMAEEEEQSKTRVWKVAELKKDSEGGELMRWEMEPQIIGSFEKEFFFTFISNYSHYAYNSNDYKKEWEIRGGEKEDDEKCWLHYIFHKNDGYLTPITLHPFRKSGNIEINNEQYLTKQRLLSLFLNSDNPSDNPYSFRRVNGKDANLLKLTEEKSSKLQQRALVEFFESTKQDKSFRNVLEEIELANDNDSQTSLLMDVDDAYLNNYRNLVVNILPSRFIEPIKQIIEQDGFGDFANSVVNWMKTNSKNKKTKNDENITTLILGFKELITRNDTYIQINDLLQNAKAKIVDRAYTDAMMYYHKARSVSVKELGENHIVTALVYDNSAILYEVLGEYDKALDYYEAALAIKNKIMPKGHLSTVVTYNNAARVYIAKGSYDKALEYNKKALAFLESKWNVNPLIIAETYNNMALMNEDMGRRGEALEYYFKVLGIRESNLGKGDLDTYATYINMADVYKARGDRDNANRYYEKVLESAQQQLHRLTWQSQSAQFYENIGRAYLGKAEFNKALNYYSEALTIRESCLGHNHRETASTCNDIAWTYYCMGDSDTALRYYEEALKIREQFLGNHRDTAMTCSEIALVYFGRGDYDNALRYYNKAKSVGEKALGQNHRDIAQIYNNIACVRLAKDLPDKTTTRKYYEDALTIREKVLGHYHPDVATTYNNMAWVSYLKGNRDIALKHFEIAKTIRERVLGKGHLDTAVVYSNIARVYRDKDDNYNALKYYKKALMIMETSLGSGHLDTAYSYIKVAWVYYRKRSYEMALKYYLLALPIFEATLGKGHPDTVNYYRIVAGAYKEIGDYVKAREYHNKTLKQSDLFEMGEALFDADSFSDISFVRYDKKLDDYERDEFIRQVGPDSVHEYSRKEEIIKTWENHDELERILLKTNNQELPNIEKYKFLSYINAAQLGRLDTIYRILKFYHYNWRIVSKNFAELSIEEKCHHYIVYKVLSILSTYSKYKSSFPKDRIDCSLCEFGPAMEKYIEEIRNDCQSHITRKIRQVENFISEGIKDGGLYERLKVKGKKAGVLLVEIDELKKHYGGSFFSLDNLPPPIYKWDIVFNKMDEPGSVIELDSFSSGEKQMLNSIGAIIYHLMNLANTSSEVKYNNVNLVLEEIELYYHPEYQRLFFSRLLDMIKRAKLGDIKNINILFVTHSPFILSDIPKCNVLFMKDGMPKDIMQENTFGANIHTLLKNGFFMPNLPIGEFSYEKINKLFGKLNSGELDPEKDLDDIYQEILLVGEPFLRNQLLMLYNSYKGSRQIPKN